MTQEQTLADSQTPATSVAEPLYLHLAITDPEVLAAVSEYPNGPARTEFVANCLKVGVLSLRAARGVVDGGEIRAAGDHLIDQLTERLTGYRTLLEENLANSLSHYFDPASGVFNTRVENLVKDDGELFRVINGQITAVQQGLATTMERFVGENSAFLSLLDPSESNRLLAAMRETVGGVLENEKTVILGQFSLDNPESALSRLVRELNAAHGNLTTALGTQINDVVGEFSLDKPDSALSRLVGRVEAAQRSISQEFSLDNDGSALRRLRDEMQGQLQALTQAQSSFHSEVVGLLSAMNARKEAEARSTTHGAVFEEAVGNQLRLLGVPAGDIVEDTGATTGQIRNCKVGDHVVTLSPDSAAAGARIVVEAKESASYSLKSTLDEADEARRNRSAGICLFVHSSRTAPAGLEPLARYGNDVVVVWNPEDPSSDTVFKAGYLTAKALAPRGAAVRRGSSQLPENRQGYRSRAQATERLRRAEDDGRDHPEQCGQGAGAGAHHADRIGASGRDPCRPGWRAERRSRFRRDGFCAMTFYAEKFLEDFPAYEHLVDSLNLRHTEMCHARRSDVCEWTNGMLPSVDLSFAPIHHGESQGGTTLVSFGEHGRYNPRITFRFDDTISIGLWLHEIGHVCCGSERPQADQASRVERHAWVFLGSSYGRTTDVLAHMEIAAWAAALILTKPLGVDHRIVLCELLLSAAVSHRNDLGIFLSSIERCESVTGGMTKFMTEREAIHPPTNELDLFTWVCDGAFDLIELIMPWGPDAQESKIGSKGKTRRRLKAAI